ncbi:hypothetical protein [Alicyclobacillus sp. SO9]|uniref:hypothetical protein n=1 Tax=Alicyclobacillus sp. SO9 TaxID=2665646 RepID=UPI0018E7F781|nr:hypothetical protein [Alicyclobacillus sp. SO9]QQE77220.1 hypothetical protein GI364_14750 [Alicyclobacillus sp. SO9]
MKIVPDAVGQSDGALVFWEETPEIGTKWPLSANVVDEIRWGVGSLEQEDCLVLYLFSKQEVAELYLPEQLPTSPDEAVEVWKVLCAWRPELIKVRYGSSPADTNKQVTFLLPASEGEDIVDKLRLFKDAALPATSQAEPAGGKADSSMPKELLLRVASCLEETAQSAD